MPCGVMASLPQGAYRSLCSHEAVRGDALSCPEPDFGRKADPPCPEMLQHTPSAALAGGQG